MFKIDTSGYLPYPKNYNNEDNRAAGGRKGGRKERRRRKEKKGRKDQESSKSYLPKIWKTLSHQLNLDEKEVEPATSACSLVPYTVDLRDVGYGKRIIAPKSYAANYCSG